MIDPTGGRGTESGPDWSKRRGLVLRRASLTHLRAGVADGKDGENGTGIETEPVPSPVWGEPLVLDDGPAAYSVAIALPDGIAVAWEHGTYETIEFTFIPLKNIPV